MFQKKKNIFIFLAIIGIGCASLQIKTMAQPPESSPNVPQDYFTGDKVPGDPVNEVKIMQRYYQCIQIYRKNHDGDYPDKEKGGVFLFDEILKHPTEYGFPELKDPKDMQSFFRPFENTDNQYEDYMGGKVREGVIDTQMRQSRNDGTAFGSSKPEGTRDVLAMASLYYHENWATVKNMHRMPNPVGFYMVLWDDGEIDKIPYDQALFAMIPIKNSPSGFGYQVVFRGEAGLPWDCMTYEEYEQAMHLHKLPQIGFPLAPGQTEPKPDNGGIESLVELTRLENQQFDREQIWDSLGHQVKDFTLDDIQAGAAKLKFPLEKKIISLDELQKLHTPAILYLNDVQHIVAVPVIDKEHALFCYQGATSIVDTQKLASEYSGTALISSATTQPGTLEVDQPIRFLTFETEDAEVTQEIKITNNGVKPVLLSLERPICGVTEAQLSSNKILPGQSATLELHFKWRDFLPGNYQRTFVTIHTDNPSQPVLQMGFQLKFRNGDQ